MMRIGWKDAAFIVFVIVAVCIIDVLLAGLQ
jgi:hypothetical protein